LRSTRQQSARFKEGHVEDVTHTKVLDVAEDLVVQGEVVAGDDVDTGILLDLPVGKTEALGLGEEVGLGQLATPVCGGQQTGSRQWIF